MPLLKGRIEEFLSHEGRPARTGAKMLDIGCGRQPFRKSLEKLGYIYGSLDVVQNVDGTVEFVTALDAELPPSLLIAAPFDMLLCTEVLEHVADWPTAFLNLSKLLRPGGCILITCPHFFPLHETPFDYWRPTSFAIETHAKRVGLNVERIERAGDDWEVLGTLLASTEIHPRSGGFVQRASAWLIRKLFRMGIRLISSGRLQRHTQIKSYLYVANIAVLRRPLC